MMDKLLICVAAALALASPAFAQSAGGTSAGAPAGSTGGATTGVAGVTGGATPYRPATIPAPGTSSSFLTNSINASLQAGQIPSNGGSDNATVGGASAGPGLRMPNRSTGAYSGAAGPTYGGPGSTPYTGPAGSPSSSIGTYAPGAVPYTGPANGTPGR